LVERWELRDEGAGGDSTSNGGAATGDAADEVDKPAAAAAGGTGGFSNPMAISFDNHRRQYEDFIDAIREDRPPAIDGAEGLRSVTLIEAIYESVRNKLPVRL